MNNHFKSLAICLAAAAFCAGCAKTEMVKQDQMIPAAPAAAKPVVAAQPTPAPAAKAPVDEHLANSAIKEAQVAPAADTKSAKDGALQTMLEKVYFDFDSSTLSPAARTTLDKNAKILKEQAGLKIRIEGNCDELGSDDYNLSLGESRAASARNYLKALGVPADRITIISYGKEKPAVTGHDYAARAQNRRDEFVVVAK